jgi:hypothetical protein
MKCKEATETSALRASDARFPRKLVSLIVLVGVAARAWLLFSTSLVPGMNGAYYLVQARALIEQGKLGIPDLPLTFCIQAGLAKIVQLVSGASLEASIVFAVKCADALLPPLVAVPVFALVWQWARRAGAGVRVPAFAALAAALGAPALVMVGDFQKNSLGLVWLAALLWSLHNWLGQPSVKRALLPVLFLGLIGVTHIGVFGWALALTVLVMTIALWRSDPKTRRAILPWLFAAGATCRLAAGLVLWKFDPARVQRLASAAAHPLTYLRQDQGPRGNPNGPMGAAPFPGGPNDFRARSPMGQGNFPPPDRGNNFAGGPNGFRDGPGGFPGGPAGGPNGFPGGPGMLPRGWNWLPTAALLTASAGALAAVWFRRKNLPSGSVAVVTGCAVGLLILSGPWVTGDKVMRFRLIAVGPALLCASFALLQVRLPKTRVVFAGLMALALIVPGAMRLAHGGRPVITLEAANELRSLSGEISAPGKTLIVARHGLEWWAAWYLHTHIAHVSALSGADWKNFDSVYFLRQKGGMQMPFGGLGPGREPRPNGQFRRGGPPDFAGGFPPPGDFPGRNPQSRPGGPGAVGEPFIPEDADITHDGRFFTLALVPTPEGFPPGARGNFTARPQVASDN